MDLWTNRGRPDSLQGARECAMGAGGSGSEHDQRPKEQKRGYVVVLKGYTSNDGRGCQVFCTRSGRDCAWMEEPIQAGQPHMLGSAAAGQANRRHSLRQRPPETP